MITCWLQYLKSCVSFLLGSNNELHQPKPKRHWNYQHIEPPISQKTTCPQTEPPTYEHENYQQTQDLPSQNGHKQNVNKQTQPTLEKHVHAPPLKRPQSAPELRLKGNEFYQLYRKASMPATQKSRLEDALNLYEKSLSICPKNDKSEKCSIHKNIAMCNKQLALLSLAQGNPDNDGQKYFEVALHSFTLTRDLSIGKTKEWVDSVISLTNETVTEALNDIMGQSIDYKSKVSQLQKYLSAMAQSELRSPFSYKLIDLRYNEGQAAFSRKQYDICLNEMYECKRLLEEPKLCCGKLKMELNTKSEEVLGLIAISESVKTRISGMIWNIF